MNYWQYINVRRNAKSANIALIAATVAIIGAFSAAGQDAFSKKYYFGIYAGPNYSTHNAAIDVAPGDDLCGEFSTAENFGARTGLFGGYRILGDFLAIDGGIYYEYRPGVFATRSDCFEILDPTDNSSYVRLVRGHEYSSNLQYISFDVGASVRPLPSVPIYFRLSVDAGNPFIARDYKQSEEIISPNVEYPDGYETKNNGVIDGAGSSIGASGAIQWRMATVSGFSVLAEFSYRYPINETVAEYDWQTNVARLGVGVFWNFGESEAATPPEKIPEKQFVPEQTRDDIIEEFSGDDIKLRETVVTQSYPLLPYIFFEPQSAVLPRRYDFIYENPDDFDEKLLPQETLDIYYRLLDVVGARMKANLGAKITVKGCTDGEEYAEQKLRLTLARTRAESIKNYLVEKWGVALDRIVVEAAEFPELPTNPEYKEGFEENRRVEISSADESILEPVVHSKFMEYAPAATVMSFYARLSDGAKVDSRNIYLLAGDKFIFNMTDDKRPNPYLHIKINEKLKKRLVDAFENREQIKAVLKIIDKSGKSYVRHKTLSFDIEKNSYELARLNLILFDFDKSEISARNTSILERFIESSIDFESKTEIAGFADKLGEDKYNMNLSRERASAVKSLIKKIKPASVIESVKGFGSSKTLFANDTPEGRFYCRTVLIEVKTPME